MRKRTVGLFVGLMFISAVAAAAVPEEDAIVGKWLTEGGKSQVEIYKTGQKYNGKIVWLKEPVYPAGEKNAGLPKTDEKNPDKARKSRPILGMELIEGFTFDKGAHKWVNGNIYNPEDGNVYHCYLALEKAGKLIVRGSIDSFGIIGKTQLWDLVTEPAKPAGDKQQKD